MEYSPTRNRVLVVDDDPSVRRVFQRMLQSAGYDVVVATGGAEALATLRADQSIGVMLLDLHMPDLDGREVRRLQLADTALAGIPTVVVSGALDAVSDRSALAVDDYLSKPATRRTLLAVVGKYCRPARPS